MAYQFTNVARECQLFGKASTRLVLMVLASCADKTGVCHPSYACLCHWTKMSRSTLASALAELDGSGVLRRDNRYRRSNIYTLSIEKLEELREPFKRAAAASDEPDADPRLDYYEICKLVNEQTGNAEFGGEGRLHLEDVAVFVESQENPSKTSAVLRWFLELNQQGELHSAFNTRPGVKKFENWGQLIRRYLELVTHYRVHPQTRAVLPPLPDPKELCEDSQHQWKEYNHTVDRCSVCETFRSSPAIARWTAADDREAECMELVEFYDPYSRYFTDDGKPALLRAVEEKRNSEISEAEQILRRLNQMTRSAIYEVTVASN